MDAKDLSGLEIPKIKPLAGLRSMVALQDELVRHYVGIEKFATPPWDMRLKQSQIDAKGFIFRVIEELGEAYESWKNDDMDNFWTELADATHFLLELGIVTDVYMPQGLWDNIWDGVPKEPSIQLSDMVLEDWFWQVTYDLTMVSNAMRNKQWKQTQVLPDLAKFKILMHDTYYKFFMGFRTIGCSENFVYEWYFRKNYINLFRIRSKY